MKNLLYILLFVPLFTNAQTEFISGCTTISSINYNPGANTDDGSCMEWVVVGCMNPWANNYDETANTNCNNCCEY